MIIRDRFDPTWARIKQHYESRLQELREQNDGRLDPTDTAEVRGRIDEIKQLLALENDEDQVAVPTTEYT